MAFLNDKQSLILCGILTVGIFVGGLLDILDYFLVRTILTLLLSAIVLNIFFSKIHSDKENRKDTK